MTTIVDGTTGITFPSTIGGTSAVQQYSGKILQVVQGTTTGYVNLATASAAWVDTGLSATITPTSTTSKILISYASSLYHNSAGLLVNVTILRNSTLLSSSGIGAQSYNTNGLWTALTASYVDSPSSTSALTYKIQACGSDVTKTFAFGADSGRTTAIILMEIAG